MSNSRVNLGAGGFQKTTKKKTKSNGNKMKVAEVLERLEKHEEECVKRYTDIQKQLDKFDTRLWGIALLIVATAIANKFV